MDGCGGGPVVDVVDRWWTEMRLYPRIGDNASSRVASECLTIHSPSAQRRRPCRYGRVQLIENVL
jgi:hypothetical protein